MTSETLSAPLDLADLFALHGKRLLRLALRLSGDAAEAEDLLQDCFLRAAASPTRLPRDPVIAERWLVRVLVNLARDRYRRARVRSAAVPALAAAEREESDPASAAVAKRDVRAALAALPPRRRAVVVMHELEELDTAEIALRLGIARVTVRWHLAAGRAELARRLFPTPPPEAAE